MSSNEEEDVPEFWDGMESDELQIDFPEFDAQMAAIREEFAKVIAMFAKLKAEIH